MIIKFKNPSNGRYYDLISHISNNGKPLITIYRGGKKKRVEETLVLNDITEIMPIIQAKTKRRLSRGYIQVHSL